MASQPPTAADDTGDRHLSHLYPDAHSSEEKRLPVPLPRAKRPPRPAPPNRPAPKIDEVTRPDVFAQEPKDEGVRSLSVSPTRRNRQTMGAEEPSEHPVPRPRRPSPRKRSSTVVASLFMDQFKAASSPSPPPIPTVESTGLKTSEMLARLTFSNGKQPHKRQGKRPAPLNNLKSKPDFAATLTRVLTPQIQSHNNNRGRSMTVGSRESIGRASAVAGRPWLGMVSRNGLPYGEWFLKKHRGFGKMSKRRFIVVLEDCLAQFETASADNRTPILGAMVMKTIPFADITCIEIEPGTSHIRMGDMAGHDWNLVADTEAAASYWYTTVRSLLPPGKDDHKWMCMETNLDGYGIFSVPQTPSLPLDPDAMATEDARFVQRLADLLSEQHTSFASIRSTLEKEFNGPPLPHRADQFDEATARLPIPDDTDNNRSPFKVMVASMNVGNAALKSEQLIHWLNSGNDADLVAVGLQESVAYAGYPDAGDSDSDQEGDVDLDLELEYQEHELDPNNQADLFSDGDDDLVDGENEYATADATEVPNDILIEATPGKSDKSKKNKINKNKFTTAKTAFKEALRVDGDSVLDVIIENLNSSSSEDDPAYVCLKSSSRGEMRLLLFAKKHIADQVSSIESVAVNTGFKVVASRLPNKGGLIVKLSIGDTKFSFVSCHLAAHEGDKHLRRRNESCAKILSAGSRNKHLDVSLQSTHCFFFGDLNYRIDIGQTPSYGYHSEPLVHSMVLPLEPSNQRRDKKKHDKQEVSAHRRAVHAVKFSTVYKIMGQGEPGLRSMYEYDELMKSIRAGRALHGFATIRPPFVPTFKVTKKESKTTAEDGIRAYANTYNIRRIPSWCDRILWRSIPTEEKNLQLIEYNSAEEVNTSDHKPISALFMVQPAKNIALKGKGAVAHILSLDNVTASIDSTTHSLNNAHFVVYGLQKYIICGDVVTAVAASSAQLFGSSLLKWGAPMLIKLGCLDLSRVCLILNLRAKSKDQRDVSVGCVVLDLRLVHDPDVVETKVSVEKLPLEKFGKVIGSLSLSITRTSAR